MLPDHRDIQELAYHLWEVQGRPDGLHHEHWSEAERRLRAHQSEESSNDVPNASANEPKQSLPTSRTQDTPGRAKPASSRQQTVPRQRVQSGSAELDANA